MKTKEIKFGVRTEAHDALHKVNKIREFILKGDRVKIIVQMRGREQAHPEHACSKCAVIQNAVLDIAKPMYPVKLEGRTVHTTLVPKR
jgi:translation initiation factor IF-3